MKNRDIFKRFVAMGLASTLALGVFTMVSKPTVKAASSNRITVTQRVKKNEELKGGKEPHLVLKIDDDLTPNNAFYLELRNSEFLVDGTELEDMIVVESALEGAEFSFVQQTKTLAKVTFTGGEYTAADEEAGYGTEGELITEVPATTSIKINLRTKVLRGEASVIIDGNSTIISSSEETFAYVDTKGVRIITPREIPSFYSGGEVAKVTLEESYNGALTADVENIAGVPHAVVYLKMYNNDFEFAKTSQIKAIGTKGFEPLATTDIKITEVDYDEIRIAIPEASLTGLEKGSIEISNLHVQSSIADPYEGDLLITIGGNALVETDVKVGTIATYTLNTTISATSKELKEGLVSGRTGKYKITLEETIVDTLANGRELKFEVDEGFMIDAKTRKRTDAMSVFEKQVSLPKTLSLTDVIMEDTKVIGFAADVTAKTDEIDDYELTVPVTAPLDLVTIFDIDELAETNKYEEDDEDDGDTSVDFGGGEEEDDISKYARTNDVMPISTKAKDKDKDKKKEDVTSINMIISGRALSNDKIEKEVTKVIKPMEVSLKEVKVKTGLKDQKVDDIIIKELKPSMIQKGNISIMFDNVDGLTFSKAPTVKVTSGDLRLGKGQLIRSGRSIVGVTFEVTRASKKESSTITLSNVIVTADRTVPEGNTGILMSGTSLMEQGDPIESNKYVRVTALNVDDQKVEDANKAKEEAEKAKADAKKEISSSFKIGSTQYTVNGVTKTMDAAPYISNGRTMMPVRYVADAFGINENKLLFHSGVVTMLGDKIVQLKIGSNIMMIDGSQIPMDTVTEAKDGRTYVPVAYISSALGSFTGFDETTKTVTFNNLKDPNEEGYTAPTTTVNKGDNADSEDHQYANTDGKTWKPVTQAGVKMVVEQYKTPDITLSNDKVSLTSGGRIYGPGLVNNKRAGQLSAKGVMDLGGKYDEISLVGFSDITGTVTLYITDVETGMSYKTENIDSSAKEMTVNVDGAKQIEIRLDFKGAPLEKGKTVLADFKLR